MDLLCIAFAQPNFAMDVCLTFSIRSGLEHEHLFEQYFFPSIAFSMDMTVPQFAHLTGSKMFLAMQEKAFRFVLNHGSLSTISCRNPSTSGFSLKNTTIELNGQRAYLSSILLLMSSGTLIIVRKSPYKNNGSASTIIFARAVKFL